MSLNDLSISFKLRRTILSRVKCNVYVCMHIYVANTGKHRRRYTINFQYFQEIQIFYIPPANMEIHKWKNYSHTPTSVSYIYIHTRYISLMKELFFVAWMLSIGRWVTLGDTVSQTIQLLRIRISNCSRIERFAFTCPNGLIGNVCGCHTRYCWFESRKLACVNSSFICEFPC